MIRKLFAGAIVLVAVYFLILGGEYTFLDIWRLDRAIETETTELETARAEVIDLEAKADSLASDSATLERLAREQFGLIRDGERLYRFAEPDTVEADTTETDATGTGGPAGRPER